MDPAKQVIDSSPNVGASILPPWLSAYTLKRKKQAISPDEIDIEKLLPLKSKTLKKKPRTVSRLINEKGIRYAEIAKPPEDATIDNFDMNDYVVSRVELSKLTHEGIKAHFQTIASTLLEKYDEVMKEKEQYKAKAEQLADVLQKIVKSFEIVDPMAVTVEDPLIQKVEKAQARGRVVGDIVEQLLAQGRVLLKTTVERKEKMDKAKAKLDNLIDSLSQELQDHEESLEEWTEMKKITIKNLITIGVISNRESYLKTKESLVHRINIIKGLLDNLSQARENSEDSNVMLLHRLEELPCTVTGEGHKFLSADEMISSFEKMVQQKFKDEVPSVLSMDSLYDQHSTFENLKDNLDKHEKAIKAVKDAVLWARTILENTARPNACEMAAIQAM